MAKLTLKQFEKEVTIAVKDLNSEGFNRLLGQIANRSFQSSFGRIFTDGKDSKGGRIGRYAKSTVKHKRATGRQTSVVNLRQTDTLAGSYTNERRNNKEYALGFLNINRKGATNAEIAEFNEKHFNKDIFDLTKQELDDIDTIINNFEIF